MGKAVTAAPSEQRERVESAERALAVLELLTLAEQPMTFADIRSALEYPRPSLFGLLNTLEGLRWIQFDEETRRYGLDIRTLEAGNLYSRSLNLVEIPRRSMERIRDLIDEVVQRSVLDDRFDVYAEISQRLGYQS